MSKLFDIISTEVNVGTSLFDTPILNVDNNMSRTHEQIIKFDVPFSGIPKVALAPSYFVANTKAGEVVYYCSSKDIIETGFTIILQYGAHYYGSLAAVDYTAIYHRKVASNPAIQTNPLSSLFNKLVYLYSSINDAYIRNVNGTVGLSASKKKNEEFKVENASNGNINFLSAGKYLCLDKVTGVVSHCDKPVTDVNKSIDFFVTEPSTGVFSFSDQSTGKKLSAYSSYDVDMNGTVQAEQEFVVEPK